MVQIRYLDGHRFRRAVLAGIEWLHKKRDYLNSINVFPVPDADTGTNMSLTMLSAAEGLRSAPDRSIERTTQGMAECAIMGSQGNSGAILAQFFQGLSDGLKGKIRITTRDFALAVERAKEAAYNALSKPKEGTILTVIKDWSDTIVARQHDSEDFVDLLKHALQKARDSLKGTTEQLEVLKKHGVVDAGAQGFIHLLEGITQYVEAGRIKSSPEEPARTEPEHFAYDAIPADLSFRYCTEGIVTVKNVERDELERRLSPLGDSIVVVTGGKLLKVHIHTNSPEAVFEILRSYGSLLKEKAQDMQVQHEEAVADPATVGIVTDSACDLPNDYFRKNRIAVVPLKVLFGDRVYLDKINLAPADFLYECELSRHHPKTSQPSVSDYLKVFEEIGGRWRELVVVSLSGAVSGTFEAAKNAGAQFKGLPVYVVDSRSVSVAQGLIVEEARRMALEGFSAHDISARLDELSRRQRFFISLRSLEYARRGGRVGVATSIIARLLNIKPVIAFDEEGKAARAGKAFGSRGVERKVLDLAKKEWSRYRRFRIAIAHVNAPDLAEKYRRAVERSTGLKDVAVVEAAAVLAAHGGPGAAGIAVLGLD